MDIERIILGNKVKITLTPEELEDIYYKVKLEHDIEDVKNHYEDMDISEKIVLSDEKYREIAICYEENHDCTLSMNDQIDAAIEMFLHNLDDSLSYVILNVTATDANKNQIYRTATAKTVDEAKGLIHKLVKNIVTETKLSTSTGLITIDTTIERNGEYVDSDIYTIKINNGDVEFIPEE